MLVRRVGMFLVVPTLTVIYLDLDLARMATAYPIEAGNEDNYEVELSRVRENIKTKFVELIDCLKARESELLRELDNILASYLSYRSELEKVSERKRDLEITKSFHQINFQLLQISLFMKLVLHTLSQNSNQLRLQ